MDALAAAFLAGRPRDRLPVSSELFRLLSRGGGEIWRTPRKLAWIETSRPLSAVGRAGGRSGAGGENVQRSMNWRELAYGQTSLDCHHPLHHWADRMAGLYGQASTAAASGTGDALA